MITPKTLEHRNIPIKNNGTINRYDVTLTILTEYIKSRANGLLRKQITDTTYLPSRRIKTRDEIFQISVE